MEITTKQYKRCDLVKAIGRIDSNTAPDLEKKFNEVLENGTSGIAFDMEEVDFISSRGLWVLLETQKTCKKNRGKLVLVNVSENMQQALEKYGSYTLPGTLPDKSNVWVPIVVGEQDKRFFCGHVFESELQFNYG